MKTSNSNWIAILMMAAALLAATNASAGGFSFGGGGGGGGGNGGGGGGNNGGHNGSFKVHFGGSGHSNHNSHNNNHHHAKHHYNHHHHPHYVVKHYQPQLLYSQCYHPQFRFCFVYPGDNWYTISKKMYGVDFLCRHIASYNGLGLSSHLVPGQQLRIPVVNSNGSLGASGAPLPPPFAPQGMPFPGQVGPIGPQTTQFAPQSGMIAPQGMPNGLAPQGMANGLASQSSPAGLAPQGMPAGMNGGSIGPQSLPSGLNSASIGPQGSPNAAMQNVATTDSLPSTTVATPAANIRPAIEEKSLPRVAIGSTLMLDGESLGNEQGIVRLRIGGIALPANVVEWSASSVKVELPKMDLSRPVKADLEVLRADGSLASSSAIELTPAATRLALSN